MAAVMTTAPIPHRRPETPTRPRLTIVPAAPGRHARPRVSAATYRRRRIAAALAAVAVVAVAGRTAGAALGSSPLAAPERRPSVVSYVVRPGDSLWTVAGKVAPGQDPRAVVDALASSRHGAQLVPGETVVWQR
jgi:hypothetical protein